MNLYFCIQENILWLLHISYCHFLGCIFYDYILVSFLDYIYLIHINNKFFEIIISFLLYVKYFRSIRLLKNIHLNRIFY